MFKIISEYLTILSNQGFIKLCKKDWIYILLKFDWENKKSGKIQVYLLGSQDKNLIDKTFDKFHRLG